VRLYVGKNNHKKSAGEVAQAVRAPAKCEALNSNVNTTKKRKKAKRTVVWFKW
jgi:hypothetical protein